MMKAVPLDLTPQLMFKLKSTTEKVLRIFHESGLTDPEILLALSMTLRHYEEKTGLRLNSVIGLKDGQEA